MFISFGQKWDVYSYSETAKNGVTKRNEFEGWRNSLVLKLFTPFYQYWILWSALYVNCKDYVSVQSITHNK